MPELEEDPLVMVEVVWCIELGGVVLALGLERVCGVEESRRTAGLRGKFVFKWVVASASSHVQVRLAQFKHLPQPGGETCAGEWPFSQARGPIEEIRVLDI